MGRPTHSTAWRTDVRWDDIREGHPRDACVHDFIAARARSAPERVAVEGGGGSLTYGELDARADALASRLRASGLEAEALVGVATERSPAMLVAVLGVLKAGGAYVPIDPSYPDERVSFMLEDSAAEVLITQRSLLDRLPRTAAEPLCLDPGGELEGVGPMDPRPCETRPEQLAYVIYTSGSTGKPKGVMIEHRALVNFLGSMARRPGLSEDDLLLAVTTLSFDIAALELFLPLVVGARVRLASRELAGDGTRLGEELDRSGATVMQATPSTWRMLIDAGWPGRAELKALCGGEALPAALADRLLGRCSELWNLYGPTETTIWSTCERVEASEAPVTIGRPIANTRVHVIDERLQAVQDGEVGELLIGGAGLARGYLKRPELTAERFPDDPFSAEPGARLYRTGDLVRRLEDGRLEFLGRLDNQVKVRGFRIELGEIETVLEQDPAVRAGVVVARESERNEKRLEAYVVPRAPVGSTELRRRLLERLPAHMVPSRIVFLDSFPLTPNGKVDRRALRPPEAAGEGRVAPRDDLERRLLDVWQEELGMRQLGVTDDFFELGVDSLEAARLFARIERSFDRRLPPTPVFQAPTVERLAALMRDPSDAPGWSSLVPIQPHGSRPPLFCVHGGAGTVLLFHPLARRLGPDQPVYALQARGLYGRNAPLTTTEEMAAHYLAEMRSVQPTGPYHLTGYCFGGLVAYEMAQQLRRSGEEVALLSLVNAPSPEYIRQHRPFFRPVDDDAPEGPRSRSERLAGYRWRVRRKIRTARAKLYLAAGRPLPEDFRTGFFVMIHHWAERQYAPRAYSGRVLVFRASGLYREETLGWREHVEGRIEVVEVPGAHRRPRDSMDEPQVEQVAAHLAGRLAPAVPAAIGGGA